MKLIAVFISICVCQFVGATNGDTELFPSNLKPFPFLKVSDALLNRSSIFSLTLCLAETMSRPLLLQ
jgi:hypothetical protein